MINRNYEPVIDGLRAVAILTVILFHAGISGISGGFIGVDIFFVISGYLITRNILSDLEKNRFSFSRFYSHRVRRLLPAMLFTMCFASLFGMVILFSIHLEQLAESLIYSSFGISNIFFWKEAGYWDTSKNVKPLLHFWSLAVEEQFYLFWPAAIVLACHRFKKKIYALWIIAGLSIISLIGAHIALSIDASAAFYLMPFRIFEFGLGAILVWLETATKIKTKVGNNIIAVFGVTAIAFSAYLFTKATLHPSYITLIPCIGAASIIYARRSSFLHILLGNRIMVGIGLISYSLYLIHWPIFIFYNYASFTEPTHIETMGLLLTAFIAAILMYKYIELPFRKKTKKGKYIFKYSKATSLIIIASIVVILLPSAYAWKNNSKLENRNGSEFHITEKEIKSLKDEAYIVEKERTASKFFETNPPKVIAIGDSYARDILNGIEQNNPIHPIMRMPTRPGCLPLIGKPPVNSKTRIKTKKEAQDCEIEFNKILSSKEVASAEIIILSAHWYAYGIDRIIPTIQAIKERTNAQIILFGNKMMHKGSVPFKAIKYGKLNGLEEHINASMIKYDSLSLNAEMKKEISKTGAIYVDVIDTFCPNLKCPILIDGKDLTIIDDGHWSMKGAALFGKRFKASNNPAVELLLKH